MPIRGTRGATTVTVDEPDLILEVGKKVLPGSANHTTV